MSCTKDKKCAAKSNAALFFHDTTRDEGKPNWPFQKLFVEFRIGGTKNDPFDDTPSNPSIELTAASRTKARELLLAYADRVFAHQHRTALFSLFVNGPEFRFMRWDRSGVFVTQQMNYVEDPAPLVEMLLEFSILDEVSQGVDPTVTQVEEGSRDWKLMDEVAEHPGA